VSKIPKPFVEGTKLRIKKEEWNVLGKAFSLFWGIKFSIFKK
jgi:hypothetical protein